MCATVWQKKLGYDNFIELGYCRMNRLCYGRQEVAEFRQNVLRDIVPAVSALRTENAKRMGIEDYKLYDNEVLIPGGDPRPCGKDGIFAAAREMYHAMSQETGEFIDMMLENEAFDVDSRRNKWGGGYCTEFVKYRQPFILANFDGTAGDVDVVTHEAGHALNAWLIADNRFALELDCGGMETAETHSMSMEFFAWPYMEKFFGDGAPAYRYMHALDAFSFIPDGTAVDEFQHIIYAHPDMTPAERNAAWLGLEKSTARISPSRAYLISKRAHAGSTRCIYTKARFITLTTALRRPRLHFLLASLDDYEGAFSKYMRFSRQGGEKLWTELLAEAGFVSVHAGRAGRACLAHRNTA